MNQACRRRANPMRGPVEILVMRNLKPLILLVSRCSDAGRLWRGRRRVVQAASGPNGIRGAAASPAGGAARLHPFPARPRARRDRPKALRSEQALEALFGGPAPAQPDRDERDRPCRQRRAEHPHTVGDTDTNTVAKGRTTRDIIAAPEGDGQSATTVIPS